MMIRTWGTPHKAKAHLSEPVNVVKPNKANAS